MSGSKCVKDFTFGCIFFKDCHGRIAVFVKLCKVESVVAVFVVFIVGRIDSDRNKFLSFFTEGCVCNNQLI